MIQELSKETSVQIDTLVSRSITSLNVRNTCLKRDYFQPGIQSFYNQIPARLCSVLNINCIVINLEYLSAPNVKCRILPVRLFLCLTLHPNCSLVPSYSPVCHSPVMHLWFFLHYFIGMCVGVGMCVYVCIHTCVQALEQLVRVSSLFLPSVPQGSDSGQHTQWQSLFYPLSHLAGTLMLFLITQV